MPDFSKRSLLPEKMDQPGVAEKEIYQALEELETINKLLGGYDVIFNALEQLDWNRQPVTIMDLGCGGGDLLRAIAMWAEKRKRKVNLIGVDINPVMVDFSTKKSSAFPNIRFLPLNVFDEKLMDVKADITMNSLFCHHFADEDLVLLIKRMYQLSSTAVIINDIHRHWLAYYLIKIIAKLFSKTYLVKYDGPLSVARSLTRKEWENILTAAGITNYRLRWMWAWRWQIIIPKN